MDVTSMATIIRIKSEFRSEILNSNGSSYSAGCLDGLDAIIGIRKINNK